MHLLIVGSTGSVGRFLVEQALAQGHYVTAFARNPAALDSIKHKNLRVVQGNALDYASLQQAVTGQDAVVCCLGAGRKGRIRSEGTQTIIRAMESAGVRRLICQTSLGVGDSRPTLTFFWKYVMFGLLLRDAYKDHEIQERYVKQSQLDWILVRPAAFTDGKHTGHYQHGFSASQSGLTLKISRADVADFIIRQLTDDTYLHKAPGLSY